VKFSVITISPISTSKFAAESLSDWESAAVVVEYLFVGTMDNIQQSHLKPEASLRLRINSQNHLYEGISWFSPESKLNPKSNFNQRSGRCREAKPFGRYTPPNSFQQQDAVPTG
jgi:hypothetical protein